jgi:hypothetical protein
MAMSDKRRKDGGPNTEASRQRYELYKLAHEQYKRAYANGFFLECVCICDSIIADRLEARLQFLDQDRNEPTHIAALGPLLKDLDRKEVRDESDLLEVYSDIRTWSQKRNKVAHQFVKVTDGNEGLSIKKRLAFARKTAKEGMGLANRIKRLVQKKNKWSTPQP